MAQARAYRIVVLQAPKRASRRVRRLHIRPTALAVALIVGACTLPAIWFAFHGVSPWIVFAKILQMVLVYTLYARLERMRALGQLTWAPWGPLRIFAAYVALYTILLALTHPGGWHHDELLVLDFTVVLRAWHVWQHYLTSLFYMLCLITVPVPAFIVYVQTLIISAVASYVSWKLSVLLRNRAIVVVSFVLGLLPPTLNMNLMPLRAAMHAYLEILLLFLIGLHYVTRTRWSSPELQALTALTVIVSIWRSECIIYLVVVPVLVRVLSPWGDMRGKRLAAFVIVSCSLAFICNAWQTLLLSQEYELTAYMPSLPYFARYALDEHDYEYLAILEEAFDAEPLARAYDEGIDGIELFWHEEEWRYVKEPKGNSGERSDQFYSNARRAFLSGVIRYPQLFLQSRWDQVVTHANYLWASGSAAKMREYIFSEQQINDPDALSSSLPVPFPTIRNAALSYVEAHEPFQALATVYNPALPLVLCSAALSALLVKRSRLALILAAFLTHHLITFLSAPMYYFMYYYSLYLCALFMLSVVLALVVRWLSHRREARHANP